MKVKVIGFDFYEYEKDGQKKEGGNVYAVMPIKENGYGEKYCPLYIPVRVGSEAFRKFLNHDWKGPFEIELEVQYLNNSKAVVNNIKF